MASIGCVKNLYTQVFMILLRIKAGKAGGFRLGVECVGGLVCGDSRGARIL